MPNRISRSIQYREEMEGVGGRGQEWGGRGQEWEGGGRSGR